MPAASIATGTRPQAALHSSGTYGGRAGKRLSSFLPGPRRTQRFPPEPATMATPTGSDDQEDTVAADSAPGREQILRWWKAEQPRTSARNSLLAVWPSSLVRAYGPVHAPA